MTSRFDPFVMEGAEVTASLYACPNIRTEERAVRVDRNTPGPMRAPPEVPFLFALESAVDEMAVGARHGPDRPAPAQRHGGRSGLGKTVLDPAADGLLRGGGAGLRLVAPGAAPGFDARRTC